MKDPLTFVVVAVTDRGSVARVASLNAALLSEDRDVASEAFAGATDDGFGNN